MPLVAVSVRSGCLSFIPGSHRRGLLPHHAHVAPDHPSLAVASGCVDPDEARACPLPAGGLSIYTSLTVHSAGPNLDRVRRRALILDYEALPRARRG
jgi:ectoine hydroxylase-related dioxygenase (phytanoyl-CoA dioxygenase family)